MSGSSLDEEGRKMDEWSTPVVEVLLVEELESEADLDVAFATTTTGCDVA